MKQCFCDRKNKGWEDLRPGNTKAGEIHGAAYCSKCDGMIMCDFCPPGNRMVAYVVTACGYACWDHGDIVFKNAKE